MYLKLNDFACEPYLSIVDFIEHSFLGQFIIGSAKDVLADKFPALIVWTCLVKLDTVAQLRLSTDKSIECA